MLVGYCDDLATPRTLGPFRDLVGSVGTELSQAVTDGSDRDRLLATLRAELDWAGHPAVLVIEDVHWADDATLDALRYLARRVADLPALLILTYRDEELHREHSLHGLLAWCSGSTRCGGCRWPGCPPARSSGSPPTARSTRRAVHAHVRQPVLRARAAGLRGRDRVAPSIADAVLARVRQRNPGTQDGARAARGGAGHAGPLAGGRAGRTRSHDGAGPGRAAGPADRRPPSGSRSGTS